MKHLLSFTGPLDPVFPGPAEGILQKGPILSVLELAPFKVVHLIDSNQWVNRGEEVEAQINDEYPGVEVIRHLLDVDEESSIPRLLEILTTLFKVVEKEANETDEIQLLLSSANSRQQACCLFARSVGLFSGTLIDLTPFPSSIQRPSKIRKILVNSEVDSDNLLEEPQAFYVAEPEEALLDDVIEQVDLIGEHPRFVRAIENTASFATHELPLLFSGESGVGKHRFAKLAHRLSQRKGKPFVLVHCASLGSPMTESILFGHKKGAFPGAIKDQTSRCSAADGGTLFIDGIDELSLHAQARLLHLIDQGSYLPLGSEDPVEADVRIIASSSTDLLHQVSRGLFRENLFYRLRGGEIEIPALRERASDITLLALEFLRRVNSSLAIPRQFSHDSLRLLTRQEFPGNVRDLQMLVERAAFLTKENLIRPRDLFLPEASRYLVNPEQDMPTLEEGFSIEDYLGGIRRRLFLQAIQQANGNQSMAARLLGVTPQAVHNFLRHQRRAEESQESENTD